MTTTYTVGAKIIINYDQSEIKSTIQRLQNFIKANPITIDKIKIDSSALSVIKTNLEKLAIKLDNVSISNIKLPSNATKEIKSKIESISFKLGNLKLDTSKIDGKKVNLTLFVPPSEILKLKQQIEGLRPIIKVQVQGVNQVATPSAGSLAQAKSFADSITQSGQYKSNTLISYDYDQAGKLIAVLKNAQNETIRLKYQFDEASKSFQQIGSSTKVPDLLNQSTIAAQRTFSDLRNITNQFNVLRQQSGSNPIDFKTQKLIPDLELLNAKLKTLSNGMQQVTQTYKLNDTQTMSVSGNYNMLRGQMDSLSTSTGNLANRQIGLGEAFSVALQRFPLWIVASTLVMESLHKLQESFEFMSQQSKLFTNLQLEMSDTNLVFSEITKTANEFATEMGATSDTVLRAIAVFGTYTSTIDEVLTKSRSAVTLSSITGQGIEQTADELMGVLTQYRLTADEITGVTDSILGAARMLQLDFPKGVAEISSGLRTVGSVAKDAGLDVAETTGILSTMIEVTRRSGSENANALRTVISRISNVGEESNPEEFKGIEAKFNAIGVAIKSSSDTIRPLGEILSELSEKWKTLNDVERQSIAQASAGMYRRNAFISLMSNYDKVLTNTTAAENSEGVTMQKQAIYAESLGASVARLTAAWEKFYLNSINTGTWKNMVEGLTVVISGFANFADIMGGIPTVLTTVVLATSLFSAKFQGFMSRSFMIAPMLAFRTSVMETAVIMRQFSGYANTWRTNPFVVGFQMAKISVLDYIASIRLATVQQNAMGRTGWASALGVAISGAGNAMRSFATSAVAARVAMSAFQAVATLGLSVAIMLVISKVMSLADSWLHADEKAKEAFDTLSKSIQALKQETSELPNLISSYEQLFDKVGKTTEEKEELSNATAKLASLFEDSVIRINDEGKAIEVDIEYVKQLTQAKKDLLIAQQQELSSKFNSMGKDQYDQILEKQNRIKEINDEISEKDNKVISYQNYNNINPDDFISKGINNKFIKDYQEDIAELSIERTKLVGESNDIQKILSQEAYAFDQSSDSANKLSNSLINNLARATMDSGKNFNELLSVMEVFRSSDVSEAFKKISEDMTKGATTEKATKDIQALDNALAKHNVNASLTSYIIKMLNDSMKIDNAPEAEEKLTDVANAIQEVNEETESYISDSKDLASTIAKMNDGHKLTTEELYKLIKAHPELQSAMKKVNGLYTIEQNAIKKLMDAKELEHKKSLDQKKEELKASAELLKQKLQLYGQEIGGITSVQQAKELVNSQSLADPENRALYSGRQSVLSELQSIEDALKGIDVSSQISAKDLIASANPDLNKKTKDKQEEPVTGPYADLIREAAKANGISATLLDALIKQESGFRAKIVSPAGAIGLTQLMPKTAKSLGVDPYDPLQNITGGAKYLKQQLDKFGGDISLALAAYNAGPGAVSKYGGIPPYKETQNYVKSVLGDYNNRKLDSNAISDIVNNKGMEDPAYTDLTEATIKYYNAESLLAKSKEELAKKELEQAQSSEDYQLQLEKTNALIIAQTSHVNSLKSANSKIVNDIHKIRETEFSADGWLTLDGELTLKYYEQFNSSSKATQEMMQKEAEKLSKLQKAWYDNSEAIDAVVQSQKEVQKTLQDTAKQLANKVVETAKSLAQAELDAEEKVLNAYIERKEAKIKGIQEEIEALDKKNELEEEQEERQKRLLAIEEAKQRLNNVLNEKNTRVLVGNQWEWQSNPTDVKDAQDDLKSLKEDYVDWEDDINLKHRKASLQAEIDYQQSLIDKKEESFNKQKTIFEEQWSNLDLMSKQLLELYGSNVDKAVEALRLKLAQLNSQMKEYIPNVPLPSNLSNGSGGGSSSKDWSTGPGTGNDIYGRPIREEDMDKYGGSGNTSSPDDDKKYSSSSSGKQTVIGNSIDVGLAKAEAEKKGKSSNFNFKVVNDGDAGFAKSGDIVLGSEAVVKDKGSGTRAGGANRNETLEKFKKITGLDTGGLTPSWGDSGKLAFLHEKELVLNKIDTSNILKAVDITRNFMNNFKLPDLSNIKLPTLNNGVSGNGGIVIQNLVVNAKNANDLISQLKNLQRLNR